MPFDGRDVELHRSDRVRNRLRAELDRAAECLCCVTTRNAIAQADGPCACAKRWPKLSGSALMMKLMSPCRCSVTFLLRWRATTGNPICGEQGAQLLRFRSRVFDELETVGFDHGAAW